MQLDYFTEDDPEWEWWTSPEPGPDPDLDHYGYTLADIESFARIAIGAARSGGLDAYTCYTLAWSAIAETLITATTPPTRWDLIQAGWAAIHAELAACMHARGYQSGNTTAGQGASPRYHQYWYVPDDDGAVERVVDGLAAVQIGYEFTAAEGSAVEALALHGDHQAAADALGVGYGTFSTRLSAARSRFRGLWFAPESAPPVRRHDKRRGNKPPGTHCSAGHEMAGDNVRVRIRRGRKRERVCRACERKRSARRGALL